ncbi:MAG: hypothetical protein K8R50_10060 [Betaproteobacteria bacterium]|nr:hypothetical protein [Betaproteobacteria bacterium]
MNVLQRGREFTGQERLQSAHPVMDIHVLKDITNLASTSTLDLAYFL